MTSFQTALLKLFKNLKLLNYRHVTIYYDHSKTNVLINNTKLLQIILLINFDKKQFKKHK